MSYTVFNAKECPYKVYLYSPKSLHLYTSFEVQPGHYSKVNGWVPYKEFLVVFKRTESESDCGCVDVEDCPGCGLLDRVWTSGDDFAVIQEVYGGFVLTRKPCINL